MSLREIAEDFERREFPVSEGHSAELHRRPDKIEDGDNEVHGEEGFTGSHRRKDKLHKPKGEQKAGFIPAEPHVNEEDQPQEGLRYCQSNL